MTDNQPDEESLSVLPLDTVQKHARDAPKGLRHVKLDNQPTELTWEDYYSAVSERAAESPKFARIKQAMEEYAAALETQSERCNPPMKVSAKFLHWIGWYRHKGLRDLARYQRKIEAIE